MSENVQKKCIFNNDSSNKGWFFGFRGCLAVWNGVDFVLKYFRVVSAAEWETMWKKRYVFYHSLLVYFRISRLWFIQFGSRAKNTCYGHLNHVAYKLHAKDVWYT